jgi:peptidyl-prolyl cis-trans isomerase C
MRRLYLPIATAAIASCTRAPAHDGKGAAGEPVVLAEVDDITITSADLRNLLARRANQPFVLARYSSMEKKKELLDSLIRYEVLAIEARKRGYANDPEVVQAAKDKMVKLFTQQEIIDKLKASDITEAEVKRYYQDHASDYLRPATVRASQIVIKAPARAARVLAEARSLPKSDMKAFRDLVARYSEDADSKQRGGDLMQFDQRSTQHPPAVVAAAFALKEIGDLSEPVSTPLGFAILKLTDRHPALSRSLEESRSEIQRHLLDELRNRKKRELVDEARKRVRVEIFEDQLARLDLAATVARETGATTSSTQEPATAPDAGAERARP